MKNLFLTLIITIISFSVNAQTIFGKWKTVDDQTGETKSIIEIYKNNGKVYGKVATILTKNKQNSLCKKCKGTKKNKPIIGMRIMEGLEKKGKEYKGGTILDPEKGRTYKCKIWLNKNNNNKLHVRGYIGLFFRTQTWFRVVA